MGSLSVEIRLRIVNCLVREGGHGINDSDVCGSTQDEVSDKCQRPLPLSANRRNDCGDQSHNRSKQQTEKQEIEYRHASQRSVFEGVRSRFGLSQSKRPFDRFEVHQLNVAAVPQFGRV